MLSVIWVLIPGVFLLWPQGTETWKVIHVLYLFYYVLIPALVCWVAFLYLESIRIKHSSVRSVAEASAAAFILLLLSDLSIELFLPKENIAWEHTGLQIIYLILLLFFIVRSAFVVKSKTG